MFSCCGVNHKGIFKHLFLKPYYRFIEYGICHGCGTKYFIDYRQYKAGKEIKKEYKNKAAEKQYKYWINRLSKQYQGTDTKEHFYFGYFARNKSGYFDTYRMNFNNKKDFLFSQK